MDTMLKKSVMRTLNACASNEANVQITVRFKLNGLKKYKQPVRCEVYLHEVVVTDVYYDEIEEEYIMDIYKNDGTFVRSIQSVTEAGLNRKYAIWCREDGSKVVSVQWVQKYIAPDGFIGTLENFAKWAERGHLHGLIVTTL